MKNDFGDIYYGECHHMFSDDIRSSDCLHRYFDIHDLENNHYRLIVCNEYLRLKVREDHFKNNWHRYERCYIGVVEDILLDVYPYNYKLKDISSNINPILRYAICERPYIIRSIDLFNALNIVLYKSDGSNYRLREIIYRELSKILNELLKYAKYSKYHTRANVLKNKIKPYITDSEMENNYLEIMHFIFELQTKQIKE